MFPLACPGGKKSRQGVSDGCETDSLQISESSPAESERNNEGISIPQGSQKRFSIIGLLLSNIDFLSNSSSILFAAKFFFLLFILFLLALHCVVPTPRARENTLRILAGCYEFIMILI